MFKHMSWSTTTVCVLAACFVNAVAEPPSKPSFQAACLREPLLFGQRLAFLESAVMLLCVMFLLVFV